MDWTLGIDTSSTAIHLGLLRGGVPHKNSVITARNAHAEHLFPALKELLDGENITPRDIAHLGVVVGPGSFTGLRIGLSFVKGLFFDRAPQAYGATTFETVARATPYDGTVGVALDARQDTLFWGTFTKIGSHLTPLRKPGRISKEEFYTKELDQVEHCYYDTMGFSNSSLFDLLKERPKAYSLEDSSLERGVASALLAVERGVSLDKLLGVMELEPLYMQLSYAEQVRENRQ
jgi:tRNA threonylcarbamoyladenosine biosynthesis protein TsaB